MARSTVLPPGSSTSELTDAVLGLKLRPSKPPTTFYQALNAQHWYFTTLCCMAMCFFTWHLPGTWKVGHPWFPNWAERATPWWIWQTMPPHIFATKFQDPVFRYGHLIIGGLWTLTAPIQLLPVVRNRWPVLHRMSGRVLLFSAASISMTVAYWMAIGQVDHMKIHKWSFYGAVLAAFAGTAVMGVRAVLQKRYADHAEWMIWHVGTGMPFATGRCMPDLFTALYAALGVWPMTGVDGPTMEKHGAFRFLFMIYTVLVFTLGISWYSIVAARKSVAASGAQPAHAKTA